MGDLDLWPATTHRRFLARSLSGIALVAGGSWLSACGNHGHGGGGSPGWFDGNVQPALEPPDEHGLMLRPGFTSRVVARSGERPVPASAYVWHAAPDGGATFSTADGGWIYVSNAELNAGQGGVGALDFAPDGTLRDAYPILQGTSRNCAGGATPWGTWLSCEEVANGQVYECDPEGRAAAIVRPALGVFNHEAVAVDPITLNHYLTEDQVDGRLYRFVPGGRNGDGRPDYPGGTLEVAEVQGAPTGPVVWHRVPDPLARVVPTRRQVAASTAFAGGEGIDCSGDRVYFSTKGDDRVWAYSLDSQELSLVYDAADFSEPQLTGVDNVVLSPWGDVLVAEDGGNLEIVALTARGAIVPVVRIEGHPFSEVAGPAFDPSGTRLYFSSQRGATGLSSDGVTYEITAPRGLTPWLTAAHPSPDPTHLRRAGRSCHPIVERVVEPA